jgi:hypothetical protein
MEDIDGDGDMDKTVDAEAVIASSGPEDKTVPVDNLDLTEETEAVMDESDDVDFAEDGLSIETAEEYNEETNKEEA